MYVASISTHFLFLAFKCESLGDSHPLVIIPTIIFPLSYDVFEIWLLN